MKRTITTKETTKEFDENGKVIKEIIVEKTEEYSDSAVFFNSSPLNTTTPYVNREITTGTPIQPSSVQITCSNDSGSNMA